MPKKEKMKKVEPIEYPADGKTIFHLCSSEANADWIRAARLAEKKDKKSKKELERMDQTSMLIDQK